MTFLIKLVRDHFYFYCNCKDGNDLHILKRKNSKIPEGYLQIYYTNCGTLAREVFDAKVIECGICKERYFLGKEEKDLASKTYELWIKSKLK